MSYQVWSGVLTAVGLAGFFLAGKKIWWAWYVNIANQAIWLIYAIATHQWPFIVGVVAYTVIFTKNAIAWTKEHKNPPPRNTRHVVQLGDELLAHDQLFIVTSLETRRNLPSVLTTKQPIELMRKEEWQ